MTNVKERLAAAKLPERSLQVCLRGDLVAEFDDLERQLREARQESGGRRRLNSKADSAAIVEQQEAVRAQMAEEMLDVRVRALPRTDIKDPATGRVVTEGWSTLVKRHPPKKGHAGDEAMGVNLEALMAEAIPACVVDPELDADDWTRLNEVLCSADYDRLLNAVWDVNRSGVDIPKSQLASLVIAERDAASK